MLAHRGAGHNKETKKGDAQTVGLGAKSVQQSVTRGWDATEITQ
jgi:hypothetical protein